MSIVSQGAADVAPGRLDGATLRANFARPASAAELSTKRTSRPTAAISVSTRPVSRPARLDRHSSVHPADRRGQPARRGAHDPRANIMGGMVRAVCPTETLCEEACVREHAEGKPVRIGLLQRRAVDAQMATGRQPFTRAAADRQAGRDRRRRAGRPSPARTRSRSPGTRRPCSKRGRSRPGSTNYGIAAYKTPDDFAAEEAAFIVSIGGIEVRHGLALRPRFTLDRLRRDFDRCFLASARRGQTGSGSPATARSSTSSTRSTGSRN